MKLKGGILYYSLLVIILTSSLTGFILLVTFFDNRLLTDKIKQDELRRNVDSAINLFLAGEVDINDGDSALIEIFDNEEVRLTKRRWGNYFIITSYSGWKNKKSERIALTGSDHSEQEPVALFMPDEGRVLSISGNTILKGTCYLPDGTARVSSIEGQHFIYKEPVNGIIRESPPKLPSLESELLRFAENFLDSAEFVPENQINILVIDTTHVVNLFRNKTLFILNDTLSQISNLSLSGNIILWSLRPIEIDSTCSLSDIIIFAPQIRLKSGFRGELQVFALQSIVVDENSRIGFPSQLCVMQAETAVYRPTDTLSVEINKNSYVEGSVVIKSSGLFSHLKISEGASVSGQIFCPGQVELNGEIKGTLYCRSFLLTTPRAKYYNHLLNTSIDNKGLSPYYTGIDLLSETVQKSIIKWLE